MNRRTPIDCKTHVADETTAFTPRAVVGKVAAPHCLLAPWTNDVKLVADAGSVRGGQRQVTGAKIAQGKRRGPGLSGRLAKHTRLTPLTRGDEEAALQSPRERDIRQRATGILGRRKHQRSTQFESDPMHAENTVQSQHGLAFVEHRVRRSDTLCPDHGRVPQLSGRVGSTRGTMSH